MVSNVDISCHFHSLGKTLTCSLMVLNPECQHRYLLHFLSVLQGLQVLHKKLGGPEVFLADCAGGDGCSTGKLRRVRGAHENQTSGSKPLLNV